MIIQKLIHVLDIILEIKGVEETLEDVLRTALTHKSCADLRSIRSFAEVLWQGCDNVSDSRLDSTPARYSLRSTRSHPQQTQNAYANGAPSSHNKSEAATTMKSPVPSPTEDKEPPGTVKAASPGNKSKANLSSPINIPRSSQVTSHPEYHKDNISSASSCSNQYSLHLISQDDDDFIQESQQQLREFSAPTNPNKQYMSLLKFLNKRSGMAPSSDCSGWLCLLDSGYGDRKKGTIRYAVIAIAFARWHASQAQLVEGTKTVQQASQQVSARILHPIVETDQREQQRKRLGTHLARGRKWLRLVEGLGTGILFKEAWKLAKSPESAVDDVIRKLPNKPKKMIVINLLGTQLDLLFQQGKANPEMFRESLEKEGLLPPDPIPSTGFTQLDELCQEIRGSSSGGSLTVVRANYTFLRDSLRLLRDGEWINDEVILACLHLSDKLPSVRIGFSVPTHQVKRPFQVARQRVDEWRRQTNGRYSLIYLFPMFQPNHFSLLEINEIENCIYHYDSGRTKENSTIKEGCEKDFPGFQYIEAETPKQSDGHSCGPLVIRHARRRMLNLPLVPGRVDGREVRAEAIQLLHSAWLSSHLIAAQETQGRKRKARSSKEGKPFVIDPDNFIEISD